LHLPFLEEAAELQTPLSHHLPFPEIIING
jgi:hypothetical protein